MPGDTWHVDLESLLQHREFVRSIVRRLVLDEDQVDDAVQQTWPAALRSPPLKGALRALLARVSRHRAADLMRSERSRARRERQLARPARVPSAAEAFEQLTLHRQVVDAVLALEEPYRSVVLLHIYEERSPRQVAAIQGLAVATVHTRLRRALALLRAEFDRQYVGDRRAWCLALLPLALPGSAGGMCTERG
jgi:RNA polymerase sigma factor (sigma-70 family)